MPVASFRDLRGHERTAVVGPAERRRVAVVVLDEGDDALGELVDRVKLPSAQQPVLEDGQARLPSPRCSTSLPSRVW